MRASRLVREAVERGADQSSGFFGDGYEFVAVWYFGDDVSVEGFDDRAPVTGAHDDVAGKQQADLAFDLESLLGELGAD